jgi:glycosyltransferase involved in cell wall biosynthesis
VAGRKIVYCHTPARWLYQADRYLRGRRGAVRAAAGILRAPLVRWDKRAAASADRYLANSTIVAERIAQAYGIDADVLPPPPAVTPDGPTEPLKGVEPGFALCVSRLLPYKNVDAIVRAFASQPHQRLVVAGAGPDETALRAIAGSNVTFVGRVTDAQLRWLYANCELLVAASHEDFGLTPLEAATFGKPSVVLRWGGFLETVREGETGLFFDRPDPALIGDQLREARGHAWHAPLITSHADGFSEARFIERIRAVVAEAA